MAPDFHARSQDTIKFKLQAIAAQITAAQTELSQKETTMAPQHPVVLVAKRKVQSLEKEYQGLAIREKKEFAQEVHQYTRRLIALYSTIAITNKDMTRVQGQLSDLTARTASLNSQIASHQHP